MAKSKEVKESKESGVLETADVKKSKTKAKKSTSKSKVDTKKIKTTKT